MPSTIFMSLPSNSSDEELGVFVEGVHVPNPLVQQSGIWIHSAGSAILLQERYQLSVSPYYQWLIVDEDSLVFRFGEERIPMKKGDCLVIPPQKGDCILEEAKDARLLWFSLQGPLTQGFLRQMNALSSLPARQGMLPTQVLLTRQIVQVLVRHSGTGDASFQLAQLLWGIIAAHCGQSIATSVTLSHEIARVVDTLRANHYKDSFSLAEMAAISRMPVETFRKRFSSELDIPPLGYLQFLKMERAKTLLRGGMNVKQTGMEVGMPDPYHFSKQFKQVVGLSPTAYLKHVGGVDESYAYALPPMGAGETVQGKKAEQAGEDSPGEEDLRFPLSP